MVKMPQGIIGEKAGAVESFRLPWPLKEGMEVQFCIGHLSGCPIVQGTLLLLGVLLSPGLASGYPQENNEH